MRQNATTIEPRVRELTPQQNTVLAALLTGKTVTTMAGEAGIARQTVHWWRASDPDFIAAHNQGRREIADAHTVRLLAMCGQGLDVIASAMGRGDVKAALAVLKGAGVFAGDAGRIEGSGDPDAVRDEQKREAKIQELNDLLLGA